jgi:hypothetical protein
MSRLRILQRDRASPVPFCAHISGSWNCINPVLTHTFYVELREVLIRFMNSSAINNNHIYIMAMVYTTPERRRGVDMTFWGWMWMYMQGMDVIYSCKLFEFWKFLRFPPSLIFFFCCSKTSTAILISQKESVPPKWDMSQHPLHNQPLQFPCGVWNIYIYQCGKSRNKTPSIFTLNMALYVLIKRHSLLLCLKTVSL